MAIDRTPSYFAVIPARVRYDNELRPNAKLLYAEIAALADFHGYCWATNEYFARLFGIAQRTISDLIGTLAKREHVSIEIIRDSKTNAILERRLWVDVPKIIEIPPENTDETPIAKNGYTPIAKNGYKNNINIYNNTPIPPKGGECVSGQACKKKKRGVRNMPTWKPERFAGFWELYPRGEAKQSAIRAWDKLQPTDMLLQIMGAALLEQLKCDNWQRGIGIPYASTWLNQRRWEDELKSVFPKDADDSCGWAEDEEVI